MASSLLEQARTAHEEIERLESGIVKELDRPTKLTKDRVLRDHKINLMLYYVAEESQKMLDWNDDKDGSWREEMEGMSGEGVFSSFYEKLRDIRDYHRKFAVEPDMPTELPEHDSKKKIDPDADMLVEFSGEESNGKYLDLHFLYDRFVNMKQFEKIDYQTFLTRFSQLGRVEQAKKDNNYATYAKELLDYLVDFFCRVQPLVNADKVLEKVEAEFEEAWGSGNIEGWEVKDDLYCKACDKTFARETVFAAHLKGKKHIRAAKRLESQPDASKSSGGENKSDEGGDKRKGLALVEAKVARFGELLEEQIHATIVNVEKKQSRTWEERQAEIEEEENAAPEAESESDDDGEKPLYNPLNLPLGWDGRPIPYWLYKLHGLNVEYKCEICGNYSYWGRRAFERHFEEWRHSHAMRCLGIPNTKHFREVTSIADAYTLYEKIKKDSQTVAWRPEQEEEYEDAQGNVMSRRTYDDLVRQGLMN